MRLVTSLIAVVLAGCAQLPAKPIKMLPPPQLLQQCPEPPGSPKTNGELAMYALDLRDALRGCNRQLDALTEWAKE